MLDAEIKAQLSQYLQLMEGDILIKLSVGDDKVSHDMAALVDEIASMSEKIKVERTELNRTPSFSVNRPDEDTGVTFAGIPLGHEFTSLILALLQVSGRAPKADQKVIDQIKKLKGNFQFEIYASLSCHNCPDVVQALNVMSTLNPNITSTMIDGAVFKEEVEARQIMAVPTVYLNGEPFASGRMSLEEILLKLGSGRMHLNLPIKIHMMFSSLAAVRQVQVQRFIPPVKGFVPVLSLIALADRFWTH